MISDFIPTAFVVVQEQVAAYNQRDLERFLATYAADAEVIGITADPILGIEALRNFYTPAFENPSARCTIETYVLFGDRWVVARESVSNREMTTDTIAIFEVREGAISRASMVKAEPIPRNS